MNMIYATPSLLCDVLCSVFMHTSLTVTRTPATPDRRPWHY